MGGGGGGWRGGGGELEETKKVKKVPPRFVFTIAGQSGNRIRPGSDLKDGAAVLCMSPSLYLTQRLVRFSDL